MCGKNHFRKKCSEKFNDVFLKENVQINESFNRIFLKKIFFRKVKKINNLSRIKMVNSNKKKEDNFKEVRIRQSAATHAFLCSDSKNLQVHKKLRVPKIFRSPRSRVPKSKSTAEYPPSHFPHDRVFRTTSFRLTRRPGSSGRESVAAGSVERVTGGCNGQRLSPYM